MTVPLWLLWTAVAALALPALFGSFARHEDSRRLRLARLWLPAAVVLVAAVVATVDATRVSEDEMYDAAGRAARSLSGTLEGALQGRVEVAVEDALGHEVTVSAPVSGPWSSNATDLEREDRYVIEDASGPGKGGDGAGPAVCLVATVTSVVDNEGAHTGLAQTWLKVERGRCKS